MTQDAERTTNESQDFGRCCAEVSDSTGYHFYGCSRKAVEVILDAPVCKTHANVIRRHQEVCPGKLPYNIKPRAK